MPIKDRTPTEQMPQEYDAEIITRSVEDIYRRLHAISKDGSSGLAEAVASMKGLQNQIDSVEKSINEGDP